MTRHARPTPTIGASDEPRSRAGKQTAVRSQSQLDDSVLGLCLVFYPDQASLKKRIRAYLLADALFAVGTLLGYLGIGHDQGFMAEVNLVIWPVYPILGAIGLVGLAFAVHDFALDAGDHLLVAADGFALVHQGRRAYVAWERVSGVRLATRRFRVPAVRVTLVDGDPSAPLGQADGDRPESIMVCTATTEQEAYAVNAAMHSAWTRALRDDRPRGPRD